LNLKASTEGIGESTGSAILVSSNLLVTNAHIINYSEAGTNHLFEKFEVRNSNDISYEEVILKNYDTIKILRLSIF